MSIYKLYRRLPLPVRIVLNGINDRRNGLRRGDSPRHELQPRHLNGCVLLADRDLLLQALPRGGVVAELGVDQGGFSQKILELNQPSKLHLIDLWGTGRYSQEKADAVASRFADEISEGKVNIHRGYSTEMLESFEDGSLDWIYIDTSHRYETTKQELAIAARKVKAGGFMCGHDFTIGNWPDYIRYGVIEAVHEFCVQHDWRLAYLTHETNRVLSFAITKIAGDEAAPRDTSDG